MTTALRAFADRFLEDVQADLPALPLHVRSVIALRLASALQQAFDDEWEAIRRELLDAFDHQPPTVNTSNEVTR